MRRPAKSKLDVLLATEDSLSNEFIYEQAMKRVTDLNRFSFSYRTLYATIIAAYVGALTLLADFSSSSIILPSIEAYALALHGITLVVFAVTLVICFYDYIFQELIETSLRTAARIEERVPGWGWGKVALISNRRGSLTSLRIAINMSLFYFVPAASLFSVLALTAALVIPTPRASLNTIVADSMCDIDFVLSQTTQADFETMLNILRAKQHKNAGLDCKDAFHTERVGSQGSPMVINEPSTGKSKYDFPEPLRRAVGTGYIVAVGFMGYFFFYSAWRTLARAFVVLKETKAKRFLPKAIVLRRCGQVLGWSFTVSIFCTFVAGLFSIEVSQVLISLTLFFL